MIYCSNCRKSKLSTDVKSRHNGRNMCESCYHAWASAAGKKVVKSKDVKESTASVPYTEMVFGNETAEHRFILNRLDYLSIANQDRMLTRDEMNELDILQRRRNEIERPTPAPTVTFSAPSDPSVWRVAPDALYTVGVNATEGTVTFSSEPVSQSRPERSWSFRPYPEARFGDRQEEMDFIVGRTNELMEAQNDGYELSDVEFNELELMESRQAELEDDGFRPSPSRQRRRNPIPVARIIDEASSIVNSDDIEEMLNDLNEDED